MNDPTSLNSLFKEKIFRIPDYQRGYAWQKNQLKDFWEDIVNLSGNRSHYTGVLTLKQVPSNEIEQSDNEYWLVEDHSYKIYHVVDGQQRLTTFVLFLQAFIEVVKELKENKGKQNKDIYISDSLNLEEIINRYLFKTKPINIRYRTYKFGYTIDNPSYNYLRYKIFKEDGAPDIEETFYTLNLRNAKHYFYEQLKAFDISGLQKIYKKLTKRFLFNEYVIQNEFDVFVAFETMNNRGKRLSDLELLKNRLIYLTTLYSDDELDLAGRKTLRDAINDAWKEVYYQLGRNDKRPLNDNDFLKAHWIMYFQYSRKKGNDYIKFLLGEQFSPQKILKGMVEREVALELPEEQPTDFEINNSDFEIGDGEDSTSLETKYVAFVNATTQRGTAGNSYLNAITMLEEHINDQIFDAYSLKKLDDLKKRLSKKGDLHGFNVETRNQAPSAAIGMLINYYLKEEQATRTEGLNTVAYLQPEEIKKYVNSLKESAVHWFNSYYPYLASELSDDEKNAIDRLNRIGMVYFRPLLMSVFKTEKDAQNRIDILNHIERFIFISFRLGQSRSNYKSSEFYNASRKFNRGKLSLDEIQKMLNDAITYYEPENKTLDSTDFYNFLRKQFKELNKNGYYGWKSLRYFLYEYELELMSQSRQRRVSWKNLLINSKDRISIEHIFPQRPTENWRQSFASINEQDYHLYSGSVGNLLVLSMSINASLQNNDFNDKKNPKFNDAGEKIRNGYSDGSHSEIEVARNDNWTPDEIEERGMKLLSFMEKRWQFKFKDEQTKKDLLFLPKDDSERDKD